MTLPALPSLITLKQAAKRIGFPYTSLSAAHHRGELDIYIIHNRWYVDEHVLAAFLERHRVQAMT